MSEPNEIFASNVFNDVVMRERLPKSTYKAIKKTIDEGLSLEPGIADVVADVIMSWAVEKGVTHFTHWFQPLTGIIAEKHDPFISQASDGNIILEFSGKELVKGEPDAFSFSLGEIRDTSEAQGYKTWDCSSPAFIRDGTLYIPTAFCAYTGEALDNKTPLLRSMDALSIQALRVLKLLGNTSTKRVITTARFEQEYFLINKKLYDQREDLVLTGRTLFGTMSPKGQELDDYYFGVLKEKTSTFMKEVNEELWKLGILAKINHNVVASSFTTANIATDHNQLTIEIMEKVALRNNMVCLLHEEPFAGINGLGKHNDWFMVTDDGINLLEPGKTPHENKIFLLFFTAVIKAVDEYSDLIRVSPTNQVKIISIFVGDQLLDILEKLETATSSKPISELIPVIQNQGVDRNKTFPFVFNGNKFEIRSSSSIAVTNYTLNTVVAEILSQVAGRLEKAENISDEVENILRETVRNHKRVIYNGNMGECITEDKSRGLPKTTTVESLKALIYEKNLVLMEKHGVLSRAEMQSRYEVSLENYSKNVNMEALTTIEMAKREILPVAIKFATKLAESINTIYSTGLGVETSVQADLLIKISDLIVSLDRSIIILQESVDRIEILQLMSYEKAYTYRFDVFEKMSFVKANADKLESLVDKSLWPFPTYNDLLFKL